MSDADPTQDLAALGALLLQCVLPAGWVPPEALVQSIELSARGTELAERIVAGDPVDGRSVTPGDATAALFIAHGPPSDPFITATQESADGVAQALSTQVRDQVIRFPWRYADVSLRAYEQFGPRWLEMLDDEQSTAFLDAMPQGMFQLGNFLTGPLGIIRTSDARYLPPTREVPGFYCDNAECSTLHSVEIATSPTATSDAWQAIPHLARVPGDYSVAIIRERAFASAQASGVPQPTLAVLADCLVPEELLHFTTEALERHGRPLRDVLTGAGRRKKWAERPSDTVAGELSPAESLQLIGALEDADLTELLDELLLSGGIRVPRSERRTSRFFMRLHQFGEIGALGFRVGRTAQAPIRLQELVEHCFDEEPEELAYILGLPDGVEATTQALRDRLDEQAPETAIQELILSSRRRRQRLDAYPDIYLTEAARGISEPERLAEVIAWKIGFRPLTGFQYIDSYRGYRDAFVRTAAETLSGVGIPGEAMKGEVRSASVNYFVAVEEFLNTVLAFSAYALTADPLQPPHSRFTYSVAKGQACLEDAAPADAVAGDPTQGARLTLGELSTAFATLAQRLDAMAADPEPLRRQANSSGQHARARRNAPLAHVAPFLDLEPAAATSVASAIKETDRTMSRSSFISLRNRLEHWREEEVHGQPFPTLHEIRQACEAFDEVATVLHRLGLAPALFNFVERREDRFRRIHTTLADSDGRRVDLTTPSRFPDLGLPPAAEDQIVVLGAPLGTSGELLRFRYSDPSPFSSARMKSSPLVPARDEPEVVEEAGVDP